MNKYYYMYRYMYVWMATCVYFILFLLVPQIVLSDVHVHKRMFSVCGAHFTQQCIHHTDFYTL